MQQKNVPGLHRFFVFFMDKFEPQDRNKKPSFFDQTVKFSIL